MEVWKDIIGYEGYYQISNLGRVKSLSRKKSNGRGNYMCKETLKKSTLNGYGYLKVSLWLNNKIKLHYIHRLVAIHFIGNTDNKREVNHINGIKTDNRIENLEWNTRSENAKHAVSSGLMISVKGEKHGRSKLTENQVLDIRERLKNGEGCTLIANHFKIKRTTISNIKHNRAWKVHNN